MSSLLYPQAPTPLLSSYKILVASLFLEFHVYVDSPFVHILIFISSVNLSYVNLILSPARKTIGQKEGLPSQYYQAA